MTRKKSNTLTDDQKFVMRMWIRDEFEETRHVKSNLPKLARATSKAVGFECSVNAVRSAMEFFDYTYASQRPPKPEAPAVIDFTDSIVKQAKDISVLTEKFRKQAKDISRLRERSNAILKEMHSQNEKLNTRLTGLESLECSRAGIVERAKTDRENYKNTADALAQQIADIHKRLDSIAPTDNR